MDKIIIKGLEIFAYHGVNESEKIEGQNFLIDTECYLDLTLPSRSDKLEDTVSYAAVKKTIERVFTQEKYDLIEKAAGVICESVLSEYPTVDRVVCTVYKPEAPMKGRFEYAAVCIDRKRDER